MLLELYDLPFESRTLHLILGAIMGLVFGVAAQISRFCLRRAVAGDAGERASAGAVWLTALAVAIAGFALATTTGFIAIDDHRLLASELPVLAIALGGLAFGAGMVLTRGCLSRLTVLGATGNLRALTVFLVFAVVAHATLKGVLAPLRTALGSVTVDTPLASLASLPFGTELAVIVVALAAVAMAIRARPHPAHLALGALIGLVPVLGWAGTSVLLMDEFDPLPIQSAAFTLPLSDSLFWAIASTSIPAGFGVGFIGGVLGGAFLSGTVRGELKLQSFESPSQTLRYALGAVLMGVGGVLAGGCTVGAGLSGVAMLSVAAILALVSIILGAVAMNSVLARPVGVPQAA